MFKPHVSEQLGYYVYRLVDPRSDQTFYIGKGAKNRVFSHSAGALSSEPNAKLDVIAEIHAAGLQVKHYIHRHGLDEATAFEIEAALIDAYPGLTNLIRGRDADVRGCASSEEIMMRYQAEAAVWRHQMLLVSINRSGHERSTYEAARFAWNLNPNNFPRIEYVLPVRFGLIVDAFTPQEWLPGTLDNFPNAPHAMNDRWGFIGEQAPAEILELYVNKRIPDDCAFSHKGIRYVKPQRKS